MVGVALATQICSAPQDTLGLPIVFWLPPPRHAFEAIA